MKVAVGLSGGVDSALSAYLLKEAGHDVTGVFLQCWRAPGCRAEDDRRDALQVALDLKIPFIVRDFIDEYRQQVVEQFFADYQKGLTPNPDIWCNTAIKFGLFYEWALDNGYDAIATGHYARIKDFQNLPALLRGVDHKKDQSYFLYRTRQEQLEQIIFPIGNLTKQEVRQQAKQRNIRVAGKPDSQGICFIGDINVREFIRERLGEKPGKVLDTTGKIIGHHQGIWFYTIGQRHGFDLLPEVHQLKSEWKNNLPPLYVVDKDAVNNTITVGTKLEQQKAEVKIHDVFWRREEFSPQKNVNYPLKVRVRHGGKILDASFEWISYNKSQGNIIFAQPQTGLASGQAVVFYHSDQSEVCLGGGVMS